MAAAENAKLEERLRKIGTAKQREIGGWQKDVSPEQLPEVSTRRTAILTPQLLKSASRSISEPGRKGANYLCIYARMLIVLTKLTAPARRQSWSRFSLGSQPVQLRKPRLLQ
jgi:hypothetical protein